MRKYSSDTTNVNLYSVLQNKREQHQSIRQNDAIHTVHTGTYTDDKLISYIRTSPDHSEDINFIRSMDKSITETTVVIAPLSDQFKHELAKKQKSFFSKHSPHRVQLEKYPVVSKLTELSPANMTPPATMPTMKKM